MPQITPGDKGNSAIVVTDSNAIKFLGRNDARVLATPWMIAQMEMTARDLVKPYLSDAEDTVGTQVNVKHLAASPLGTEVHFEAEVIRTDGRRIEFRVAAWDAAGMIGEGTHERAIVNVEKFAERLRQRQV